MAKLISTSSPFDKSNASKGKSPVEEPAVKEIAASVSQDKSTRASGRTAPSPQLEAFRRRLYALMLAKGWTQSELARRADLPRDSVSTYVRGIVTPTPVSLKKLASALDTTPEELWPGYPENGGPSETPAIEMSIIPTSPNNAWLRINCQTGVSTALKIIELLKADDDLAIRK